MTEPISNVDQNRVLDDVRRALGRDTTLTPKPLETFIEPTGEADVCKLIDRFTEEATAVRAQVHLLSVDEVIQRIIEICDAGQVSEVALSNAALFAEISLASAIAAHGLTTFAADETDHEKMVVRLANCGVGLTAADFAIAETGTIVLSSDEQNSLLVSLLPPVHIALIRSSQIAATLDNVISKLDKERMSRVDPSRSVSFITGPSRTSDVELVLSIGVHGPKELHVVILD